MNNEQLLQQTQSGQQIDASSLGIDTGAMMQQVETLLLWGTLASAVILIPFLILYILSARRKSKAYKAIIDIQAILHEMNERDKAREVKSTPAQPELIASASNLSQPPQN
jgi:hypothetical protein